MTAHHLRHQVGQLFIVGLGGPALDAAERGWLRVLRPGGLILFRRNIEEPGQTTALLREATAAVSGDGEHTPVIRAVDLEGGLVDRLRDVLAPSPAAAAVAATGSKHLAERHGELIGRAARLLGFNTTFAPVLDLALPQSAPVMRTRVYGPTADAVIDYARPFLQGLRTERVLACGKHFPGLGGGNLDSHAATPRIVRTWNELWDHDMKPYRELGTRLPLIMVAHAAYPRVGRDGERPASVSRFWITDTLRRRLEYNGLIVSDDMEMGGLLTKMSIEEAAVQAIAAGSDLLEVCKDPALIFRAYEAVLAEAERSQVFRLRIRRTCERVRLSKSGLLSPHPPQNSTVAQLARIRSDLHLFTVEIEAQQRVAAAAGHAP